MTISMLSMWRDDGTAESRDSALMGVESDIGRGLTRVVDKEDALAKDFERESERVRVDRSPEEPGSLSSPVNTRRDIASSAVRN